ALVVESIELADPGAHSLPVVAELRGVLAPPGGVPRRAADVRGLPVIEIGQGPPAGAFQGRFSHWDDLALPGTVVFSVFGECVKHSDRLATAGSGVFHTPYEDRGNSTIPSPDSRCWKDTNTRDDLRTRLS